MISEIVYHGAEGEPLVAHGILVPCPCCGHSLMLSARLLASTPAPAALSLSEHTEAAAAADGPHQPSAAKASGRLITHEDCAQYQAYYRGAPNGRCCDPELGGGMTVPADGPACRVHFVEGWRDGNDD